MSKQSWWHPEPETPPEVGAYEPAPFKGKKKKKIKLSKALPPLSAIPVSPDRDLLYYLRHMTSSAKGRGWEVCKSRGRHSPERIENQRIAHTHRAHSETVVTYWWVFCRDCGDMLHIIKDDGTKER
jgi:hypothetical protein